MIKAKTGVNLLRHLGIVLIVLPEPITTPFGVALGFAAHCLSRRLEASLNRRLREMLEYYLARSKRFGDYADDESGAPGRIKRHTQSEEHLIPWQHKGSRRLEAKPSPLVRQSWRDTRDDIVHHGIDMQMLCRRYGIRDDALKVEPTDSHLELASGRTRKLVHHSIDVQMLDRRYGTDGVGQVKVK